MSLRRFLPGAAALILCLALLFRGVRAAVTATMPPYAGSLGGGNYTEKITGRYLVAQSSAAGDLILFGSSELRTLDISTHPANFFAGERCGFQVNLVGRGSCQSIIHAVAIAASGDSLTGRKVALITSPQSYVPGGIAPDLFLANFSEQQYLALMDDPGLSEEVKRYISGRVLALTARYEEETGSSGVDPAVLYLAQHSAGGGAAAALRNAALAPYYAMRRSLLDLKDKTASRALLNAAPTPVAAAKSADIDWAEEERLAVAEAEAMSGNNDFGMSNDYYTTYIGARLSRQQNKDANLSYAASPEYDDLRVLFEICRQKGIEPLFIHVPLHGAWSDYTGFPAERRAEYYDNVRLIAEEYGVGMLDLTAGEYEPYMLCDVMHLGWRGWLEVDRALIGYYYGG